MNDLKKLGIEIVYLIAGFAGAFVSMHKSDERISVKRLTRHVLSGGLTAMYVTPVVSDLFRINSSGLLFCAFVTGYTGYKMVDMLYGYFKKKFLNREK